MPEPTEPTQPTEVTEAAESTAEASEPTAEATEPTAERSGRQRLGEALRHPGRSQIVVGALLALLGFAAVTQVRSTELDDTYAGRREEDLIEILNGLTGTSDRARREIERLEQTQQDLQTDTNARQAAVAQAEERLTNLNILAGLVPVTGPGLRITITEQAGRVRTDSLLDMVQELRTAGAEAMEFNDTVRLVAQSSFGEANGQITLDGVVLETPYVLEVIGEPHTLHTGLTFPSGPISRLEGEEGAEVVIEELTAIDIESVREQPRTGFAEAAEGQ